MTGLPIRRFPAGPIGLLCAAGLCAAGLWAPAHADPMRPLPGAAVGASAPAAALAMPAPAAVPGAAPLGRLVAIRQDSAGRRQALVGERWVAAGDRLDQSRVVAIGPNAVEIATGRTRSTLHLLPPLQASKAVDAGPTTVAEAGARRAPAATASPAGNPTP